MKKKRRKRRKYVPRLSQRRRKKNATRRKRPRASKVRSRVSSKRKTAARRRQLQRKPNFRRVPVRRGRRRPSRRKKRRTQRKPRLVAFLLSFRYPGSKGKQIDADLIVPAKPGASKNDVIEIAEQAGFTDHTKSWLIVLLSNADDEDITVSRARNVKVPKKIIVRSATRGGHEIYSDESEDSE